MTGLLVKRFLEDNANIDMVYSSALEEAFNLPKIENDTTIVPLKNRSVYSYPTHTVQRATTLLNNDIDIIDNDTLLANISAIIKERENALAC